MTRITAAPRRGFPQQLFERRIAELAAEGGPIKIIEAGCGRAWGLSLEGVNYHLTGIDVDAEALRARRDEGGDLDEAIVGDLRTTTLDAESYDVIYCAFVLEHIHGAQDVVDRLTDALRPGGLFIVRIPDRDSVWGFVTRLTPFRFHVLYRRWFTGDKMAGKPGHAPYATSYDKIVSHRGMTAYCAERGLEVLDEYSSSFYLQDIGRMRYIVGPIARLISVLSLGRVTSSHNNLNFVIRKPVAASAGTHA
jgi:SAM-dependent methyltransferase